MPSSEVKSSAIAKHWMEWSDILRKDSHTPGNTTELRLCRLFKTTYAIQPNLVIVANSQLRESLCKFRIGGHQLKIETGRYQRPVPPPIERLCKETEMANSLSLRVFYQTFSCRGKVHQEPLQKFPSLAWAVYSYSMKILGYNCYISQETISGAN